MAESKSLQEWRNSNSQKEAPCSDQIIKDIGQQLKASWSTSPANQTSRNYAIVADWPTREPITSDLLNCFIVASMKGTLE